MSSEGEKQDSARFKKGILRARPGLPLSFSEEEELTDPEIREKLRELPVGDTVKAYRDAAKRLLASKYQDLNELAPSHLKEACDITILICDNGIIVRYDTPTHEPIKIRQGLAKGTLSELGPPLSEYLIHFPTDPANYDPGPHGPQLELAKFRLDAPQAQEPIAKFRPLILAQSSLPSGVTFPPPPHKPPLLISMTNEIEVILGGVIAPAGTELSVATPTHEFVARSKLKLNLGWQAIEVFAPFDPEYWKSEYAPLWAETDLLAAVARKQFSDRRFASLDPNVVARRTFQNLVDQFTTLLGGSEEPLHQFLREHPQLLCPTHTKFWSKLRFGDRVSDFVFRQPANEYLLVELEGPLRDIFRKDGQPRAELTHAFNQILDWHIYLEDHLSAVQDELGFTGISSNPESLIVIGRSASLTDENRRKIAAMQNQVPKLRVLTYEDLLQNAKAVAENLFGPLDITGENVDIAFIPL